ncbi:MAG: acyl-ACP--UDP-N-acetylglucosamine O-acyltransferase [Flavobacteriales bacterium]
MNQPLAYIHPEAKIADNVVVEPFTSIHKNVEIGEGTWIGSNVTIMEGARIGKNVRIFPGAVISAIPQDLKFGGEDSIAVIGDNTTIRECVTINRGTNYSGKTVVGENCLLMAYSHVAHDCFIGNNCVIVNNVALAGHVTIGDFAIIGGLTAVHQFVNIGEHVMIGGGSLVRKDVPPYVKASKEPLSFIGINSIGLRRRGFSPEKIVEIQDVYRIIFQSGFPTNKAIELIEAELPVSAERDMIINFVRNAKRGIMKGYTGSSN